MMPVAELIVWFVGIYVAFGALFATAFVTLGLGRIDEAARGATRGVRLILIPGSVALWPILLQKWLRGGE